MTRPEKAQKLAEISAQTKTCRLCPLFQGTTNAVPGFGNPDTKILFIGEAPGYWEDQKGLPFVGPAGKLLDELLSSLGLKREEVFIANMIKHRPPGNRDPQPTELEACSVYLDQQIDLIDPEIIVTLGRFSMNKFLPGVFISGAHGIARFVEFKNRKITVVPMYHPAAALRNGKVMEQLKADFLHLKQFLQGNVSEPEPPEEESGPSQLSLV
jgi:uracil-DNA glycosylase